MPKLSRKGEGKPLRDAMDRADLTIEELAEATKAADPAGKGISPAAVGRLTSRGKSARQNCELKTALLVAEALREPLSDLFAIPTHLTVAVQLKAALRIAEAQRIPLRDLFPIPPHSTSTAERSRSDAAHEG